MGQNQGSAQSDYGSRDESALWEQWRPSTVSVQGDLGRTSGRTALSKQGAINLIVRAGIFGRKMSEEEIATNSANTEDGSESVRETSPSTARPASCESSEKRDLTVVPGVVGELIEWIVSSARRPNRLLALGAALTIVGTLIGRRIAGPTRSGTHLYVVALAGTGAGKQHAIDCIKSALISARAKTCIGPGEFTSSRAVVRFVKRQPLSLCAIDEFGAFLHRIGNRNAGHYETATTGELRKLWGISFSSYNSAESAHEDSQSVESPALTIYGVSTPEEFYTACRSEDVGNGFLNRFVIIETGERGPENDPPSGSEKVPVLLQVKLQELLQPTPFSLPVFSETPSGQLEPGIRLQWGPGAKEIYTALSKRTDDEQDEQKKKLIGRVPEIAVRIATIRCAGQGSSIISVDDMQWGCDLATFSAETLCTGVAKFMVMPLEFSEICPEIVKRVRDRGGEMSKRDIKRSFEKHVKRGIDIDLALKHLLESEQLVVVVTKPEKGGRPSTIYNLAE